MGTLRFLLSLAVVFDHVGPVWGISFCGGIVAVETFFIVSGFAIAFIFDRKYGARANGVVEFYKARFFRIYPLYWSVLFLGWFRLALSYFRGGANEILLPYWGQISWESLLSPLFLVFSNLLLIGQDWLFFLKLTPTGALQFSPDGFAESFKAFRFAGVPQAWSLGIEVLFYALAPFLIRRRTRFLAGLCLASLSLKIFLTSQGLSYDPWLHRFFPCELFFFLAGIIIYRISNGSSLRFKVLEPSAFCMTILLTVGYRFFASVIPHFSYLYYAWAALALPLLYRATASSTLDRFLGKVSFSIYLSHVLIVGLFHRFNITNSAVVFAGSVFLSCIPYLVIEYSGRYSRRDVSADSLGGSLRRGRILLREQSQ